jgi:hypothetical protein
MVKSARFGYKGIGFEKNEKIINDSGLDLVFIISTGYLGVIQVQDLIGLGMSKIFNIRSPPKLVSVWLISNERDATTTLTENGYNEVKNRFTKYLLEKFLEVSKTVNSKQVKETGKHYIPLVKELNRRCSSSSKVYFLTKEREEIKQRLSAFFYHGKTHPYREHTIRAFKEILKEVDEFKNKTNLI